MLPCEERGLDLPQVVHQLAVEPAHQLAILVQTKIQQPIGRSGGTGVEPRRCSVEAQAFLQPPASAPPRRGVLPASRRRGVWPHHASGPSPKVTRPSVYQGPDCWRRDRVAFSAGCRTGRTRRHVRAEQTCLAGGIVNQRFERAVGFGCKRHGAGQNDSFAFCFSSRRGKNLDFFRSAEFGRRKFRRASISSILRRRRAEIRTWKSSRPTAPPKDKHLNRRSAEHLPCGKISHGCPRKRSCGIAVLNVRETIRMKKITSFPHCQVSPKASSTSPAASSARWTCTRSLVSGPNSRSAPASAAGM